MRTSTNGTVLADRNQFTRQCIAEALLKLMQTKDIAHITITDIVKVAGVSRMTFYKYYETKTQVLSDYLYEIVNEFKKQTASRTDIGSFNDYVHIRYSFEFFKDYSSFIHTLIQADLYSILINALNDYMDTQVLPNTHRSKYELYYYAGALCNTYVKWIEGGMKETPEEIASVVSQYLEISKKAEER